MLHTRDFVARVAVYRPDVVKEHGNEHVLWAIRETVRTICRRTGLAFDTQYGSVSANTHSITLSSIGNEISRVEYLRVADLPGTDTNPTTYLGTFDGNTGVISMGILEEDWSYPSYSYPGPGTVLTSSNASDFPTFGFFQCVNHGNVLVSTNSLVPRPWDVGDVVLSQGLKWWQYKTDAFNTVGLTSRPVLNGTFDKNQSERGWVGSASREGNNLYLYPPPIYDTAYYIEVGVVPNLIDWNQTPPNVIEMETIPLPVEAEGAIVAGALEIIFRTPAGDPKMMSVHLGEAEKYGREFKSQVNNLRAMALLGSSGSSFIKPTNFSGRSKSGAPLRSYKDNG